MSILKPATDSLYGSCTGTHFLCGRKLKFFFIGVLLSLLMINNLVSQQRPPVQSPEDQPVPEFSDEELENFAEAVIAVLSVQQENYTAVIEEIEGRNLTIERFNEILEAWQMGQNVDATEEEMDLFEDTLEAIREIQLEYENRMIGEIENAGLSVERYEEILLYYQQDPELRLRIDGIFEDMDHDIFKEEPERRN